MGIRCFLPPAGRFCLHETGEMPKANRPRLGAADENSASEGAARGFVQGSRPRADGAYEFPLSAASNFSATPFMQ